MNAEDRPPRRSVEELQAYYWRGEGRRRALAEARKLLDAGAPIEEVAEAIGWSSIPQLLRALAFQYSRRAKPGSAA